MVQKMLLHSESISLGRSKGLSYSTVSSFTWCGVFFSHQVKTNKQRSVRAWAEACMMAKVNTLLCSRGGPYPKNVPGEPHAQNIHVYTHKHTQTNKQIKTHTHTHTPHIKQNQDRLQYHALMNINLHG